MPSEEQEVTLVMQSDHLATLKLGKRREKCLEHSSDGVT
jgi:hypothetical protein